MAAVSPGIAGNALGLISTLGVGLALIIQPVAGRGETGAGPSSPPVRCWAFRACCADRLHRWNLGHHPGGDLGGGRRCGLGCHLSNVGTGGERDRREHRLVLFRFALTVPLATLRED